MNIYRNIFIILLLFNNTFASLILPTNNSTLNYTHVLFEWEQEFNAESYTFYLDTNSEFPNPIIINNNSLIYIDTDNINWDSSYYWKVRPEYLDGTSGNWSDTNSFYTGSKRSDAYSIINDTDSYQDGTTIFSSFFNYYSAMIDKDGNEIWNTGNTDIVYYSLDYYGQLFGCYVNNDIENYLPGIEFSIDNEFIWEEPNDEFLHHELLQLPNGNYMGLIEAIELGPIPSGPWTPLYQSQGYNCDGSNEFPWVGDKIVIWDKDTKNIIWEWDTFDYFSMLDYDTLGSSWFEGFGNNRYDWTHANAFYPTYDESGNLEYIYLSSRHLSRITKIDYNTKDVVWNMGLDLPSGDVDCGQDIGFSWQHSITLTDDGNIITLDNGNISQLLLQTDYPTSRGLEIEVNENNNACTTNIIWEYSLPEEYFGFASGNVQKLDNGNYLIVTVGDGGTALEVDANNNHIWEGKLNLQLPNGAVYRANRVSGLYPIAFSVIIEDMYTESGTNYIDNLENETITLNLYNEGSSPEDYDIYLSINNNEWQGFMPSQGLSLDVNESDSYELPLFSDANIVTIKIIPEHRSDLEKNITIYLNGCTDPVDCLGVCGGNATEDCAGTCGGTAVIDCSGTCGGSAVEDCAGICGGSSMIDCEDVCGGNAELDVCGICNGNSSLPCNECGDGYTLYNTIPNSTVVLDGSSCFNDIDISALNDIITTNSLSVESPIHLGTQNWNNGRITRLEAGNYYQGGLVNLTSIPESIENMSQLSVLYLDYNSLTQLPNSITNLSNLFYLVLPFNQLTSIPENIGNLANLFWLDIGYNEVEYLPESIGNLQGLTYLWIFGNNLTTLPNSFCDLNLNWDNDDYGFIPYFAAGGNQLCDNIPDCVLSSSNFNSAIDPLYYTFEITLEQECEEGCNQGDLNNDATINVTDIIAMVNIVLDPSQPTDNQLCGADLNGDGTINVVDIIALVNIILS